MCNFFFLIKGTWAWYTRVLCCMVLEFTKLEYHIFFLIAQISTQQATVAELMKNSNFWNLSSRKSGTLPFISEIVFFWYMTILAQVSDLKLSVTYLLVVLMSPPLSLERFCHVSQTRCPFFFFFFSPFRGSARPLFL